MSAGRRRILRVLLLILVPLLAIIAGLWMWLHGGRFIETDNAFVKAPKLLVSPDVAGAVKKVLVTENQVVEAGQALLKLDDAHLRLMARRANAGIAEVRSDLNALRAQYREKQAEIALARTNFEFAQRVLQRQKDLMSDNFATASNLDDAQHEVNRAGRQIETLRQNLASIAERLGGGVKTPPESHPRYQAAVAELALAQLQMRRSTVLASLPGIVSRLPEPGQYFEVGETAMALVGNSDMWIEANFTETELTHMRNGQTVTITIDTYPDIVWEGFVQSVSPATGAEFAIIPPQNATGNWVKIPQRVPVRIRLIAQDDQPRLLSGMSAVVEVDTHHRRTLFGWGLPPQ